MTSDHYPGPGTDHINYPLQSQQTTVSSTTENKDNAPKNSSAVATAITVLLLQLWERWAEGGGVETLGSKIRA